MLYNFDPAYYRQSYPDLAHMTDDECAAHYQQYGIPEGRVAAYGGRREEFVALIPSTGPVLEIGPFCSPALAGDHVRYADVMNTEELRARAVSIGSDPAGCPPIHYVLRDLDLNAIPDRFAAIFSSHCIEHQPDLVAHFQAVQGLLSYGGAYYLIVPDKRYCFDHFLPNTSIADILAAHTEHRKLHHAGSVIEHYALTTHNDPIRHWAGDHGEPRAAAEPETVGVALENWRSNPNRYIDVHAWKFTPHGLAAILAQLKRLGLIDLVLESVFTTPVDRCEFCVVLRKPFVLGKPIA